MDYLASQQSAEILQLRTRRRRAAEHVRELLQQLEIAKREFEAASHELAEAEAQPGKKAHVT